SRPLPLQIIYRRTLRQSRGAVAGSSEARALLTRHGLTGLSSVLPQLGVDLSVFRLVSVRGDNVVGFVGRLVPQKGLSIVLQAIARISTPCRLMIVGSGPLEADVRKQARELGIAERCELHTGVAHRDIPELMARMTVLVLPSITTTTWKEQFGHVLIEAMAS